MISTQRLRRFPHFANMPLDVLNFIAEHSHSRNFKSEERILIEGNTARELMFLEKGKVNIIYHLGDDRDVVVDTIIPGETFSWSAALPPHKLSATAIAIEDGELFGFESESLLELCGSYPGIGCTLMTEIAQVLRRRLINARVQLASADNPTEFEPA